MDKLQSSNSNSETYERMHYYNYAGI